MMWHWFDDSNFGILIIRIVYGESIVEATQFGKATFEQNRLQPIDQFPLILLQQFLLEHLIKYGRLFSAVGIYPAFVVLSPECHRSVYQSCR